MRFQFRARLHKSNPIHNDEGKGERCEVGYAVAKKMPIFFREFMSAIFLLMIGFFPFLGWKRRSFQKRKTQKSIFFPLNFKYKLTKREKEAHVFVSWLYNNGIVMLLVEFLPNFIVNSNLISIYVRCRHLLPLHKSLSYDSKLLYRGCGGPFSCHFEDNNLQRRWHWEGFDNQRNRGCRLPNCVCMPK